MTKKISLEQELEIINQYKKSPSMKAIAREIGVDFSRIKIILKDAGIKVREITRFTPELKDEAIRLYKEGFVITDIAGKLKVCKTLLKRHFKEHLPFNDLRVRPFQKHKKEAEIINHYKKHRSYVKLRKDLGVTPKTVKKILTAAGVEIKIYQITPELEQETVKLYKQGTMIKDIASMLEFSTETISKVLVKHNVRKMPEFRMRHSENRPAYFTSPNVDEEIIKMYQAGISTSDIGPMFNAHSSTIVRLLDKYNIKINNRRNRKITLVQEHEIISRYKKGTSASAIAKNYGVRHKAIVKLLKRNGIEIEDRQTKITPEKERKIVDLYQQGLSSFDIALEFKVAQSCIIDKLNKNKIPLRHTQGQKRMDRLLVEKQLQEKINQELQEQNQPIIFKNKNLEEFFSKHKINIQNRIVPLIALGIPEEHLEEYFIFIRQLAERNRFSKPNPIIFNSLLLNQLHAQSFLQKIEGKLRNINYQEQKV